MSAPCSCGGDNANCFKCFGSGLVSSQTHALGRPRDAAERSRRSGLKGLPAQSKGSKKSGDAKSNARAPSPVATQGLALRASHTECPICLKRVPTNILREHLLHIHPQSPAVEWRRIRRPLPPVRCPVCSVKVANFESHFQKVHQQWFAAEEAKLFVISIHDLECGACDYTCDEQVSMIEHLCSLHGFKDAIARAQERKKAQPKTAPHVNEKHAVKKKGGGRRRYPSVPASQRDVQERDLSSKQGVHIEDVRLDAKLNWGASFRDHGQFGSYPSHDAMDDESSP